MAGPQTVEWRRSFPSRSLAALARYALCGAVLIAAIVLLFGEEPDNLNSGRSNPLAYLPLWTELLVAVGAVPFLLAVLRPPRVAANHYALTVRPGWIRSLVLPWSRVAEVTVVEVNTERYLLIRYHPAASSLGNSPSWPDQTVLRALSREGSRIGRHFDVALRMRDFATEAAQFDLAALAAFAPDHVLIAVPETGHHLRPRQKS